MTAKKPLELSSRPCIIANVNLRTEKHGDEDKPAVDIKLSGIMLTKAELLRLTGDQQAWNLMFEQEKAGSVIEPVLQMFEPERYLKAKYEDCTSTIRFGMQKTEHELDEHKIKGIALKPQVGGMTELTLTIQQALDDTKIVAQLAEYQGQEAHVSITFGQISENEKRQKNLALNDEPDKAKNRFGADESPPVH